MNMKISALLDGELEPHEVRELCIAMRHDAALRSTATVYVLIGDALRKEPHLTTDIAGAVLDHLADEPVVLAPQNWSNPLPQGRRWHRPLMAMAATLAGVAVVAWFGLVKQPAQQLAMQMPVQQHPLVMAVANPADADMQEYLIAHQLHSGSIFLNSEAQHIRTVSMSDAGAESR